MENIFRTYYSSPIGILEISGTEEGIASIIFVDEAGKTNSVPEVLNNAYIQLEEYFNGRRKVFDLKLDARGTDFQRKVWDELINIPFGETVTYKDIAIKLGDSNAVRAVGNANGKNPVSIVVPCHRVIGTNGKLTGYAGGLERKAWLLKHEKDNMKNVI
jgi:methylated-DNA-[protein]-cysteine S-methyltransferase